MAGFKNNWVKKNKNNKFMEKMDPNSDGFLGILRYMYVYESNRILWVKYRYLNQEPTNCRLHGHCPSYREKKHATHRRVTIMVAVNVGAAESSKICGKFQRKSWEERHGLY